MNWWKVRAGKRAGRVLLGIGTASFVAGLALLVFAAYSLFDNESNAQNQLSAAQVTTSRTPAPRTVSPTPGPSMPSPVPAPPLGDAPYQFVIERLGVDAPVGTYGLDENAVPVVPTGGDAAEIVAWYDFSAKPGTGSNAVFAGHVTWNGEAVFYELKTSKPGDLIKLRRDDGTELIYSVTWVNSVDPDDPESLKVMYPTDPLSDVITVITCDGAYQDTDDPVFGGEYSRRLVVRAERIS